MSKKKFIKVITDLSKFEERTDEILGSKDPIGQLKEIQSTIVDLKNVLRDNRDNVCVCAPQIGSNLRLFIVETAETSNVKGKYKIFINPMIVTSEGIHLSRETNLSLPGREFIVTRYDKVHVAYQDEMGHFCSETYVGSYGEVVQQMIQMLDGITLVDVGLEVDNDFDNASDKDRQTIIQMYIDSLKNKTEKLTKEIEADANLKNLNDIIKMQTGLLTGNIVPLDSEGNPVANSEIS